MHSYHIRFFSIWRLPLGLILDRIGLEIIFNDHPDRKEALLGYENVTLT